MSVILLVETREGEVVGVRFPDTDAARDWEDMRVDKITCRGAVRIVTRTEAMELS